MTNSSTDGLLHRPGVLLSLWTIALAWIGTLAFAQQLTVRDILQLPQPPPDHRIAYGDHPLQFGDLRLPQGEGPFPVVVFIHGGCWRSQYTLDHTAGFNAALARKGYASWSLEYRRVGDEGGGWPGTFLDVAAGTDHLRKLADEYPLDLNRVVAAGHSAGGHLALWLAARRNLPRSSLLYAPHPLSLKAVLSLAGVPDLKQAVDLGTCGKTVQLLMGGTPDEVPEHYQQGSPIELLPIGIPLRLIHAAQDSIVPPRYGLDFEKAAHSKGDNVQVIVLEDSGHFEMIAPETRQWVRVLQTLRSLFN